MSPKTTTAFLAANNDRNDALTYPPVCPPHSSSLSSPRSHEGPTNTVFPRDRGFISLADSSSTSPHSCELTRLGNRTDKWKFGELLSLDWAENTATPKPWVAIRPDKASSVRR